MPKSRSALPRPEIPRLAPPFPSKSTGLASIDVDKIPTPQFSSHALNDIAIPVSLAQSGKRGRGRKRRSQSPTSSRSPSPTPIRSRSQSPDREEDEEEISRSRSRSRSHSPDARSRARSGAESGDDSAEEMNRRYVRKTKEKARRDRLSDKFSELSKCVVGLTGRRSDRRTDRLTLLSEAIRLLSQHSAQVTQLEGEVAHWQAIAESRTTPDKSSPASATVPTTATISATATATHMATSTSQNVTSGGTVTHRGMSSRAPKRSTVDPASTTNPITVATSQPTDASDGSQLLPSLPGLHLPAPSSMLYDTPFTPHAPSSHAGPVGHNPYAHPYAQSFLQLLGTHSHPYSHSHNQYPHIHYPTPSPYQHSTHPYLDPRN